MFRWKGMFPIIGYHFMHEHGNQCLFLFSNPLHKKTPPSLKEAHHSYEGSVFFLRLIIEPK